MLDGLTVVLLVLAFAAFVYVSRNNRLARERVELLRSQNYDWYKREFPELVSDGSVTCYKCKSEKHFIARLANQGSLRTHNCRGCGTTLYYSSES